MQLRLCLQESLSHTYTHISAHKNAVTGNSSSSGALGTFLSFLLCTLAKGSNLVLALRFWLICSFTCFMYSCLQNHQLASHYLQVPFWYQDLFLVSDSSCPFSEEARQPQTITFPTPWFALKNCLQSMPNISTVYVANSVSIFDVSLQNTLFQKTWLIIFIGKL